MFSSERWPVQIRDASRGTSCGIPAGTHLRLRVKRLMRARVLRQLTRTREDGTLYVRPDEIEKNLAAILELDRDTLERWLQILDRRDVEYVPSECIIYMLREAICDNRGTWFETLYK